MLSKHLTKKIMAVTALSLAMGSTATFAHGHHDHWHHRHWHHRDNSDAVATGLFIGAVGVIAGAAIANSQAHDDYSHCRSHREYYDYYHGYYHRYHTVQPCCN